MESLAGKEPFVYGRGVAVNKTMTVWGDDCQEQPCFITAWDGYYFRSNIKHFAFSHACFPAEQTENDGSICQNAKPNYDNVICEKRKECKTRDSNFCDTFNGHRFCGKSAETKTRPLTAKECALLPHGTMFRYESEHLELMTTAFEINDSYICTGYALHADMTDGEPSTWTWRPLTKECNA